MPSIKIIALALLTALCWSTANAQPIPTQQMRICEVAHQIKIEVDAWNKGGGKGPFLDLAKYGPDLVASIGKDGLFHNFIGTASVGVYGRSHLVVIKVKIECNDGPISFSNQPEIDPTDLRHTDSEKRLYVAKSYGDPVAETLSALWWVPFATQRVRIDGNLLYSPETANLPEGFAGVFMAQMPILVARYSSLEKIP